MASTWSSLKIELLETGQNPGQWGNLTNVNLGDAVLGEAITGQATVDFASDADVTITLTDSATTQAARNLRLNITESSTGVGSVRNLILGSGCQIEKFYLINNTGTGAKTVKNTSGTGITVPAGKATLVYNNGTNVVDAASYFTSLTLGSALPVASGGTGVTTSTGTTNVVLSNSPTLVTPVLGVATGTSFQGIIGNVTPAAGAFTTVTASTAIGTASGGTGLGGATPFTSGGVVYASSTSALATGSAMTFDTTKLQVNVGQSNAANNVITGATLLLGTEFAFRQRGATAGISGETYAAQIIGGPGLGPLEIYTAGSYPVVFGVSATEGMRLTSTSLYTASGINVGIGTSSPNTKLQVNGGAVIGNGTIGAPASGYQLRITNDGAEYYDFGRNNSTGYFISNASQASPYRGFIWAYGGTAQAILDSAGNLGLGVTPSAWSAYKAIQTTGASFIGYSDGASNNQAIVVANAFYDSGANWKYIYTDNATRYRQFDGEHQWSTAASGTAGNAISFTQALTLDASGNLLIGVTGGTHRATVSVDTGADRDIFISQVSGASNGFRVQWNNSTSTIRVNIQNLPTSASGLTSGTLYNDSGFLKVA